jgi:hypothetical protein
MPIQHAPPKTSNTQIKRTTARNWSCSLVKSPTDSSLDLNVANSLPEIESHYDTDTLTEFKTFVYMLSAQQWIPK